MGLINWKSPHEELVKTVEEELPKALRWLKKKTSDVKTRKLLTDLYLKAERCGGQYCIPTPIEYTSNVGNQWLMIKAADREGGISEGALIYGLTGKYMWAVTPLCENGEWLANSEYRAVVFTPHFFQRFYERLDIQQDNRIIALRNFLTVIRRMPMRMEHKKDGGYRVLLRLIGCVCYGHTEGRAVYVNTILPETHLYEEKLIRTRGFRRMSDSDTNTYEDFIERAFYQDRPVSWFKEKAKEFGIEKKGVRLFSLSLGLKLMLTRVIHEYRKRLYFMDDCDSKAAIGLLDGMLEDFQDNRKPRTFENLSPWMAKLIAVSHKEIISSVLAETLEEMKKIGGDGLVDFDNYHYMADRLRKDALKELKL